jgi:hypothetical protein
MNADLRFPYTYAYDYVRSIAGYNQHGTKLSRADAALIVREIAERLGIPPEMIATKLAEHYLEHEQEIAVKSVQEFTLAARLEK